LVGKYIDILNTDKKKEFLMAKVIKEVKQEPWKFNLTCGKCTSVLEVEANDLHLMDGYRSDIYIYCPVCRERNLIDKVNVPKEVMETAWYHWFQVRHPNNPFN
jgi:hypothetical protein